MLRKVKENRNCPYCLSPVDSEEQRLRCPQCGVIHHVDCWNEHKSCSVYGCDGWDVWTNQNNVTTAPDTPENVEVTPQPVKTEAKKEVFYCIKCGEQVKSGQLVCRSCRIKVTDNSLFENCFGPSVLFLFGFVGLITLVVRALT